MIPNIQQSIQTMKLPLTLALLGALAAPATSSPSPTLSLAHSIAQDTPREQLDVLVDRLNLRTGSDVPLAVELQEHLRAHPALVNEVPGLIRSGAASLDASRTLIFALERVGTLDAQRSLVEIQGDEGHRQLDRLRAVISLGALDAPSDLSLGTLWTVADQRLDGKAIELSNGALLGLGISGHRLRASSPEGYSALRDGLLSVLHGAGDSHLRCIALKAVGNLHDPVLGGDVQTYLFSPQPTIRATAAQAIAMSRAADLRELLGDILIEEPHGIVRATLVEALRTFEAEPKVLAQVHTLVRTEVHTEARAEMVKYLVDQIERIPEARETLIQIARTDSTTRVRMLAAAVLRR